MSVGSPEGQNSKLREKAALDEASASNGAGDREGSFSQRVQKQSFHILSSILAVLRLSGKPCQLCEAMNTKKIYVNIYIYISAWVIFDEQFRGRSLIYPRSETSYPKREMPD